MAGKSLDQLLQDQFGVQSSPRINPLVDQVGLTAVRIVPNNPNRVGLTIVNISAASIWILIDNSVSGTHGILLAANGGSFALNWQDDLHLLIWEWYAIASGAASDILVIEEILS